MRDFNSEPKDIFPVNESAGGEHGDGGNLDYDGVVADHHDEGDIDDALPVSGSGHNGFEHAAAAEPEHSRGGVAVLERPNEVVDAVRDPRNPGVWYSDAYFDRINAPTHSIERGDVGAAAGGTPPGPPKPPSEYGAGFPDDPEGSDGEGDGGQRDITGVDGEFLLPMLEPAGAAGSQLPEIPEVEGRFDGFVAAREYPAVVEGRTTEIEFTSETTMLRRMELLARMGQLTTYFEGVYAGGQVAEQHREAERASAEIAAAPTPIAEQTAAALEAARQEAQQLEPSAAEAAPTEFVELTFDSRTGLLVEADAPQDTAPDVGSEVERREETGPEAGSAKEEANWWSGPEDDVLSRVLSGLRRADVGLGQEDPEHKIRARGVVVEEPTAAEIEAAGGDVMAARAEKIARAQQGQIGPQNDDPQQR